MEPIEPFTVSYKLIGCRNYLKWRFDLLYYVIIHRLQYLFQEGKEASNIEDDPRNIRLLQQMRATIDEGRVVVPNTVRRASTCLYYLEAWLSPLTEETHIWSLISNDFKLLKANEILVEGVLLYKERQWTEAIETFSKAEIVL